MVSCLSTNTNSSVGWYVDSGASKHMTFNEKFLKKFQEQDVGIQAKLRDDATYVVNQIDTVSFRMPLNNVLNLHDVLFVHILSNNLFLVSTIANMKCIVEFNNQ